MKDAFRQLMALAFFVILCFGVAALGSRYTAASVGTWYSTLQKPAWNPPSWVFGPVWSFLYLAMAFAAWLVWRQKGFAGIGLSLFFGQLFFNFLWSLLFFGLQNPGLAMLDIVVLWVAIIITMVAFWRVTPVAGWLFVPYLLWVSYASTLNFAIWRMNPQ